MDAIEKLKEVSENSEIVPTVDPEKLLMLVSFTYGESIYRPWYVFGPDLATARTYAHLSKATALFIDQARIHAPENREK